MFLFIHTNFCNLNLEETRIVETRTDNLQKKNMKTDNLQKKKMKTDNLKKKRKLIIYKKKNLRLSYSRICVYLENVSNA